MQLVVVFSEEESGYSVSVPALPGCFSQGETLDEAKKNIVEAIQLYLEETGQSVAEDTFIGSVNVPQIA